MATPKPKCPVCFEEGATFSKGAEFQLQTQCRNCGGYLLAQDLLLETLESLGTPARAELSRAIRGAHDNGGELLVSREVIESYRGTRPTPPPEQLDRLILWLGKNLPEYGSAVSGDGGTQRAAIGVGTARSFSLIVQAAIDEGFVKDAASDRALVRLTLAGWRRFKEIGEGHASQPRAFMAMPFRDALLDRVYAECFRPAVKRAGFDLRRVDEEPTAGAIDDRIRVEIRTSRFLVAELTGRNAGAYFEAGFAEGLGRPVFYTCEKSFLENNGPHFDSRNHLTIGWSVENLEEAADRLTAAIRNTLPGEARLRDE